MKLGVGREGSTEACLGAFGREYQTAGCFAGFVGSRLGKVVAQGRGAARRTYCGSACGFGLTGADQHQTRMTDSMACLVGLWAGVSP